ncbi:DNA repair protein XRCC2-like isoform X1 [Cherax quadricarinatus]|uniref:DNA repair protein XRCC2-like isoform X1 n=2 Tax=Cherax quadricarinatus TaxID=27406 RepID=UPI00387EE74A
MADSPSNSTPFKGFTHDNSDEVSIMSYSSPWRPKTLTSPAHTAGGPALNVSSESGIALLARLVARPSLSDLDSYLFPGGPQPGDVIEVTGNMNYGKSSLGLHLVVSVLLPRTWRGINIGGCGGGVVFVDSDLHFSILHLENMLQRKVKKILKMCKDAMKRKKSGYSFDKRLIDDENSIQELLHFDKMNFKNEIDNFVKTCLKSFFYLKCTDSSQFAITLLTMDELLLNKSNISLIVIDSISAYYWYDRAYRSESWYKLEQYYSKIWKVFIGHVKRHKLVLFSTRQSLFQKRPAYDDCQTKSLNHAEEEESEEGMTEYEYMGREWASHVTCRIHLSMFNMNDTSFPLSDQNPKSCVTVENLGSSPGTASVGGVAKISEPAVISDDCRQMYTAEVSKNGKKHKLVFTIHEDGLKWSPPL